MPAEETIQLRLVTGLANEEQQMPLFRFALHDGDIEPITQMRGHAEFEELPAAVTLDIQGIVRVINPRAVSLAPTRRNFTHLEPGAHLGKPGFNRLSIHIY